MQRSPYTPGSLSRIVPGREEEVTRFRREISYTAEYGDLVGRISVAVGPRGIGKTSLLRYLEVEASSLSFTTVWITAGDGPLLEILLQVLQDLSTSWADSARARFRKLAENLRLTVGPLSFGGGADEAPHTNASAGRAVQDLVVEVTSEVIRHGSVGLCLFIDELQAADAAGIKALAYAWQQLQAENPDIPAMVMTAGLGHTQDVVTDAVSFAERFDFGALRDLSEDAERRALTEPAERLGVHWDAAALDLALTNASGYPYFLQLIGDETWRRAGDPDVGGNLTVRDVQAALKKFRTDQEVFFRARWKKATVAEARLIQAMAEMGEPVLRRREVAEYMGKQSSEISMVRSSLIDKGIIQVPRTGYLEFTAPGFAEFVRQEVGLD
jgi:hypothetical protein